MTDLQQAKIILARAEGESYKEISKRLSLSPTAVRSFCNRSIVENGCRYCGKPLEHTPHRRKKSFCNDICRMKWWNKYRCALQHKDPETVLCPVCGKPFQAFGKRRQKYCSRACYFTGRYHGGNADANR